MLPRGQMNVQFVVLGGPRQCNRCHAPSKCERAFPMFQMEPSGGKFGNEISRLKDACRVRLTSHQPQHLIDTSSSSAIKIMFYGVSYLIHSA